MTVRHKVSERYSVQHRDNRGRDWLMHIDERGSRIGFGPNTWLHQVGYDRDQNGKKRVKTIRCWFKTLEHFQSYKQQPELLAVLSEAVDPTLADDQAMTVKQYLRIAKVKIDAELTQHPLGVYYVDADFEGFLA